MADKSPIVQWTSEFWGLKPTQNSGVFIPIQVHYVTRSDGTNCIFSQLYTALSDMDRDDLLKLRSLILQAYSTVPGTDNHDRMLWNDLMNLFNPELHPELWEDQEDWEIIQWRFHDVPNVHSLELASRRFVYMFVNDDYPLSKQVLSRMVELQRDIWSRHPGSQTLLNKIKSQLAALEASDSSSHN